MPDILKRNSKRWTKNLLDAREKGDKEAIRRAKRKYNKQEIREALEEMYSELCCYCETLLGVAGFGRIEHRRPMNKFPQDAFNWNNLHWACEICNNSKGDKWDYNNPILDPTVDIDIIPTHIEIVHDVKTNKFRHKTDSGKTTIEHANLNRPKLAKARYEIYNKALKLKRKLDRVEESLDNIRIKNIKEEINDMKEEMYGSCIKAIFE